jgi:hypothetical protein
MDRERLGERVCRIIVPRAVRRKYTQTREIASFVMASQQLHPIFKSCSSDNRMGRTLCYDRLDMPDPQNEIPNHVPARAVPFCDGLQYVGMDPTQFAGAPASLCLNPAISSVIQHMDEARDGYMDSRAYKRTSRLVAPLPLTNPGKRVALMSGVTLNQAPHGELDVLAAAGARGSGPMAIPKGRIVGRRAAEMGYST